MSIKSVDPAKDILKARPNLKPRSIDQYVSQLQRLQKMFGSDKDFNFLDDFDKVKKGLSEFNYLSQRNFVNAIIVLLMALNIDAKLIDQYVKLRDKFNDEYNESNLTGIISDKQAPNFTTSEEIFRMLDMMKDDLKDADETNLSKKEKQLLQAYVLFSIYARMPLRNETGGGMKSITAGKFNKLSQKDKTENNFLIVERDRMYFLLNDYKTNKNYGALKIDITDKELKSILKNWIKIQGYGILFKTSTDKPITRIELSKIFSKYSDKYLNKKISTNLLRKIYLSSKYAQENGLVDQLKNLEADNEVMMHSKDVALNVYIKKPQ